MFAIRKIRRPDEWLIFQPGGRLDYWGPRAERAEFQTRKDAEAMLRIERAEGFAEIVDLDSEPR